MPGRVVLFGATGYTGRLTAEAMVERDLRPVLAARSGERLGELAAKLGGGLETVPADVEDPPSVKALVEPGDVLVSTVGPFVRFGRPAAASAVTVGAHYLDSTGEPPWIREVFERYGPVARKVGCGMLTAFGYDFVPGNLAGALALRAAGEDAVRIDVGYFVTGLVEPGGMSGGTRASLLGVATAPMFGFRAGRIRTERAARRVRDFEIRGDHRPAVSIGSSEHFALPRVAPQLREVNTYLGWFGPTARPLQALSLVSSTAMRLPGARRAWGGLVGGLVKGSTGGPSAEKRTAGGTWVVASAYDGAGRELAEARVSGIDGYTFTGRVLAWGAERAAAGGLLGRGALGPADGFGLDELRRGCEQAGLAVEVSREGERHEPAKEAVRAGS
jgi:short subunit dehydrogenase-like uncharacterized protein